MTRADYYAQLRAFRREQARRARADRARARRNAVAEPTLDAPRTTARERALDRAAEAARTREEQS